jgi:Bacterial archaeo-eukaryotic release factor family 10
MLTAETINRIIRFDGRGLPVTSLYAPVAANPRSTRDVHSRVSSLVDQITPLAKDSSAEHDIRLSVRADIERIREAAREERWQPGGIAIFACSGRDLYEEVPLPRPVRDRIVVDATPYVRPMLAVLDEYHRACVAVVDKASARLWEFYQDEISEVNEVHDRALRKANYAAGLRVMRKTNDAAGLAGDRLRIKADELSKRHYRNVAQLLDDMYRSGGFELLIIGGHDYEVPAFTNFLPRELRPRIAGTFSIDPGTDPIAEIRAQASAIMQRHERAEERQMVTDVFEKLAAGGLAVAGLPGCLWAGSVAAIGTLLALEGATMPGVVCRQSGWLALSGDVCPLCGNPTTHTPDVIDELAEAVIDEGGAVRHVEDDDRLSEHLVAANLRFPLPPRPADGS